MEGKKEFRTGISALIDDWLSVKGRTRNLTRLATRTGIGPKRLKSLSEGESEPTIPEAMSLLNVILPGSSEEHKRFLLKHYESLPWAREQLSEEEEKAAFRSMDFETQQKVLRQKLSAPFDSIQKILEEYDKHVGYLVEELVEKMLRIEAIEDQVMVRYKELSTKRSKTLPEKRAKSYFRMERRKRWTLEKEILYLKSIIHASGPST